MATFHGKTGDDFFQGSSAIDTFLLDKGGEDTALGGGAGDTFDLGGALSSGDHLDGGEGVNILMLEGDYQSGLFISAEMVRHVTSLILSGDFSYDLTLAGLSFDATQTLFINAFHSERGETIRIDGSQRLHGEGGFQVQTGAAAFTLIGSHAGDMMDVVLKAGDIDFDGRDGQDQIEFGRAMTTSDHVDGGDDWDEIHLSRGQKLVLDDTTIRGMELLRLEAGSSRLVMADGNVSAGANLWIDAQHLEAHESVRFDGSAELDGTYVVRTGWAADLIIGGAGDDTLEGSLGDDTLIGGAGADDLAGDDGADRYVYRDVSDSTVEASDYLRAFDGDDLIDLRLIDANSGKAGNQAFKLVDEFTGKAGQLTVHFDISTTTVAGDVDGDGQADLQIVLEGKADDFTGFVL